MSEDDVRKELLDEAQANEISDQDLGDIVGGYARKAKACGETGTFLSTCTKVSTTTSPRTI